MFASFDNSINDLWIADKTHAFYSKSEDLGGPHPMLPAVKPSFDRWFFLTLPANDCAVAACKLLHFTVFNVLSGGDQPRPDDPHPFFAWGTSGASRRWSQLRLFQRGNTVGGC